MTRSPFPRSLLQKSALLAAAFFPIAAQAAIISTTGAVSIIAAPASVNDGALESNTKIFAFPERQNVALTSATIVDMSVPGTIPVSPGDDNFSTALIPVGTVVRSYYLHCDVVGVPGVPLELTGSATFDTDIIGIIIVQGNLNLTAAFPGLSTTTYSTISGFEVNTTVGFDSVSMTFDRRTVFVDIRNGTSVDDVRILTAAPEPASLALLSIAATPLLLLRRRAR